LRDVLIRALIEPSDRHGSVCESIRSFDRSSRSVGGSAMRTQRNSDVVLLERRRSLLARFSFPLRINTDLDSRIEG
jgi:hypothetical protein